MVMRTSGPISFTELRSEFGSHVSSINDLYYKRAPAADTDKTLGVTDDTLPSSGEISFSHFYGKSYKYLELYQSAAAYTYSYIAGYTRCFPAGTKVRTKTGLINIENLKVGDEVLSVNYRTSILHKEFKKVEKVLKHTYQRTKNNEVIFKITPKVGEEFYITNNHPVMHKHNIENYEDSFTPIENLKVGDKILNSEFEFIEIKSIDYIDHDTDYLYNLEVEEFNTYLVNEFVVHNGGTSYKSYYTAYYASAYVPASYSYRVSIFDLTVR